MTREVQKAALKDKDADQQPNVQAKKNARDPSYLHQCSVFKWRLTYLTQV
jgi:hypothetical protein